MIKVYMKDDFDYSKYVINSPYFIRKDKNTYYFFLNNKDCINLSSKLNLKNNDIADCLIECSNNIFTLYFWETFSKTTGNNHDNCTTYYYGCYCDDLYYSGYDYDFDSDDIIKLRKCDNEIITPVAYEICNYFLDYFNENYSNIKCSMESYPKYIFNNQHNSKYISIKINRPEYNDLIQDMTSFIDSLKSVKSKIDNSMISTHILISNPGYVDPESDEYKYGIEEKERSIHDEDNPLDYYDSSNLYSKDYVDEDAPDDDYYDDENLPDDYYY